MNPLRCWLAGLVAVWATSTWPARAHSALDPAPRGEAAWRARQELINQRVLETGDKAKVLFVGDSITQGWEADGKEVWARYYAHRQALNLGIGGDRTQHVLWRLEQGNLDGLKPKVAVVMIGTNNTNGEDNTPGQIVDGVAAVVRLLRIRLPEMKVILLAIFPRNENYSPQRGKLAMVNQVLPRLADNRDVFWIDFGGRFLNDDGTIPRDLMPDYLHLSAKGYALWAEAIEPRLAAILGDEPITPAAARLRENPAGDWVWTLRDPQGTPVESGVIALDARRLAGSTEGRGAPEPSHWIAGKE